MFDVFRIRVMKNFVVCCCFQIVGVAVAQVHDGVGAVDQNTQINNGRHRIDLSSLPDMQTQSEYDKKIEQKKSAEIKPTVKSSVVSAGAPLVTPTVKSAAVPIAEPLVTPTVKPVVVTAANPLITPTVKSAVVPAGEPLVTATVKTAVVPTAEPSAALTVKPAVEPPVALTVVKPLVAESSMISTDMKDKYVSSYEEIPKENVNNGISENITDLAVKKYESMGLNTSLNYVKDIVLQALKFSPALKAASAGVTSAEYVVKQVEGQRWPQVKLGVTSPLSNFGDTEYTANNNGIDDTTANVLVSTPVYDWGLIKNQVNSAKETENATRYLQSYSREQLAYDTLLELININRYADSKVIAGAYVKRMQELVNMLSEITKSDPGRASELVQAQAKLLSAETSLINIENDLDKSYINLTRLLGEKIEVPSALSWQDMLVSSDVALGSFDKSPMLLNLKSKINSADFDAESVKSASLPKLNWVISKNTMLDSMTFESGWYTGLNVEWDAFSGGSQKAAEMSARAKSLIAKQEYEKLYRDTEYRIKNQVQTRDSSLRRAESYERLATETDRIRQMFYGQWYHLGKRTLLDVLTAESDHFNNQVSAINNKYDGYIANIYVLYDASLLLTSLGIAPK